MFVTTRRFSVQLAAAMLILLIGSILFQQLNFSPVFTVLLLLATFGTLLFGLHGTEKNVQHELAVLRSKLSASDARCDALARDLESAAADVAEKERKLGQADRLSDLGQLTATVSHEIRNPLSVIRTAIHVMRQKTEAEGINLTRPLDRAQRAVGRCDDIVNDMLEYARANELRPETVDSSAYLNEILDEQAVPANITLVRELPDQGVPLLIDRDRFRRAIINLVSNAIEAIKEGEIAEGLITVTCLPECPRRSIQIFNNGPAIPQDVLDRMYEPLYTTKSNGSGIGLPTVKKLIEQHNAELHCETGEGVGTRWSILMHPDAATNAEPLARTDVAIAA